jgi:hypothetical protein
MKRTLFVFLSAAVVLASPVFALTDADAAALTQFSKDYVSWSYSGHPVEFRRRLDFKSFEEQRQILLKLAEIEWKGTWGDYWRRLGVNDTRTLREFTPAEFWARFNSVVKSKAKSQAGSPADAVSVDVHAITEARGLAYVIYQAGYSAKAPLRDGRLEVLRARFSDGEWRLIASPRVTADLRRQLETAEGKK